MNSQNFAKNSKKRVVVTGYGVVSALGNTPAVLFENLLAGGCAVKSVPEAFHPTLVNQFYAPVDQTALDASAIERKYRRSMGVMALFAAIAAKSAITDSQLSPDFLASGEVGCMISSTTGASNSIVEGIHTWESEDRDLMPAMQFFKCVSHTCALNVANLFGINGIQLAPSSACASATQSIGAAYEAIQLGKQTAVVAGGADELSPMTIGSFSQLFATAESKHYPAHEVSRPFDSNRQGLVCGEGAGILVLEEYEHAIRRNAKIHFEIIGYATNCSGHHVSQSDAQSIQKCMALAMADANVSPSEVDYINAHATATLQGDLQEAIAIEHLFGKNTRISSLKGHLGHTLGASGAIETIITAEMMRRKIILPNLNFHSVDADFPRLNYISIPESVPIEIFVKNSFAFGGINATLIGKNISSKLGN